MHVIGRKPGGGLQPPHFQALGESYMIIGEVLFHQHQEQMTDFCYINRFPSAARKQLSRKLHYDTLLSISLSLLDTLLVAASFTPVEHLKS